jgi:hypothetical protein
VGADHPRQPGFPASGGDSAPLLVGAIGSDSASNHAWQAEGSHRGSPVGGQAVLKRLFRAVATKLRGLPSEHTPQSGRPGGVAWAPGGRDSIAMVVRFVNAVLAQMHSDGQWAASYARWIGTPVPTPPPARYSG